MILKAQENEVITNGVSNIDLFGIDENSLPIIFDILRNKMYTDPIAAICREIASNSRDANRENNNQGTKTEITLIKEFLIEGASKIIFKDNGKGMSPETIKNVYTKYGASTKRNTNDLTGGFGLGSKTPFAYSDIFDIKTIYEGVMYQYKAYIDDSGLGAVGEVFKPVPTDEKSGTEITIHLREEKHAEKFAKEIVFYTTFWGDESPILHGDFPIENKEKVLNSVIKQKEGYYFIKHNEILDNNFSWLVIDGIPFKIHQDFFLPKGMLFFVENGVVTLPGTRETLQYDEITIKFLKELEEKVMQGYKIEIASKVDKLLQLEDHKGILKLYLTEFYGLNQRIIFKQIIKNHYPDLYKELQLIKYINFYVVEPFTYAQQKFHANLKSNIGKYISSDNYLLINIGEEVFKRRTILLHRLAQNHNKHLVYAKIEKRNDALKDVMLNSFSKYKELLNEIKNFISKYFEGLKTLSDVYTEMRLEIKEEEKRNAAKKDKKAVSQLTFLTSNLGHVSYVYPIRKMSEGSFSNKKGEIKDPKILLLDENKSTFASEIAEIFKKKDLQKFAKINEKNFDGVIILRGDIHNKTEKKQLEKISTVFKNISFDFNIDLLIEKLYDFAVIHQMKQSECLQYLFKSGIIISEFEILLNKHNITSQDEINFLEDLYYRYQATNKIIGINEFEKLKKFEGELEKKITNYIEQIISKNPILELIMEKRYNNSYNVRWRVNSEEIKIVKRYLEQKIF